MKRLKDIPVHQLAALLAKVHGFTITSLATRSGVTRQNLHVFLKTGTNLGKDKQLAVLDCLGFSGGGLRPEYLHIWSIAPRLDDLRKVLEVFLSDEQRSRMLIVHFSGCALDDAVLIVPSGRHFIYILARRAMSIEEREPITSETLGCGVNAGRKISIGTHKYENIVTGEIPFEKELRDFFIAESAMESFPSEVAVSEFDAGLKAAVQGGLDNGLSEAEILIRISIALSV